MGKLGDLTKFLTVRHDAGSMQELRLPLLDAGSVEDEEIRSATSEAAGQGAHDIESGAHGSGEARGPGSSVKSEDTNDAYQVRVARGTV